MKFLDLFTNRKILKVDLKYYLYEKTNLQNGEFKPVVLNLLQKMLVLQLRLIFHDEHIGALSKTYNNNFCLTSGGMIKKGPILPSLCQKSPEEIQEKF